MTRAELKKQAKELLKGNRSYGAILTLLIAAVFIVMGIIDPKASFYYDSSCRIGGHRTVIRILADC